MIAQPCPSPNPFLISLSVIPYICCYFVFVSLPILLVSPSVCFSIQFLIFTISLLNVLSAVVFALVRYVFVTVSLIPLSDNLKSFLWVLYLPFRRSIFSALPTMTAFVPLTRAALLTGLAIFLAQNKNPLWLLVRQRGSVTIPWRPVAYFTCRHVLGVVAHSPGLFFYSSAMWDGSNVMLTLLTRDLNPTP